MSPRPDPPSPPSRRSVLAAATSVAALLAVGGAGCSSASAPPSASSWTAMVGPSGTLATPQMEALRIVAERVPVPPSSPSAPADDLLAAGAPAAPSSLQDAPVPATPAADLGGTWACSYFAVGAASGSTFEVRIDDLAGHITPEPGQPVAMDCLENGAVVYQEVFVFDPSRPFGRLDELLGGTGG